MTAVYPVVGPTEGIGRGTILNLMTGRETPAVRKVNVRHEMQNLHYAASQSKDIVAGVPAKVLSLAPTNDGLTSYHTMVRGKTIVLVKRAVVATTGLDSSNNFQSKNQLRVWSVEAADLGPLMDGKIYHALGTDGENNAYLASTMYGYFQHLTFVVRNPAYTAFVASYTSLGAARWVTFLGGVVNMQVGLALAGEFVVACGTFAGALTVADKQYATSATPAGFIVALTLGGAVASVTVIASAAVAGVAYPGVNPMALSSNVTESVVYVAGGYVGQATFSPTFTALTRYAAGFVAAYAVAQPPPAGGADGAAPGAPPPGSLALLWAQGGALEPYQGLARQLFTTVAADVYNGPQTPTDTCYAAGVLGGSLRFAGAAVAAARALVVARLDAGALTKLVTLPYPAPNVDAPDENIKMAAGPRTLHLTGCRPAGARDFEGFALLLDKETLEVSQDTAIRGAVPSANGVGIATFSPHVYISHESAGDIHVEGGGLIQPPPGVQTRSFVLTMGTKTHTPLFVTARGPPVGGAVEVDLGTSSAFTGLTPGALYYVGPDGALTTSSYNNTFFGTSISTTTIQR